METIPMLLQGLLYVLLYAVFVYLICLIIVKVLAAFKINGEIAKIVYLIGGVIVVILLVRFLIGVA